MQTLEQFRQEMAQLSGGNQARPQVQQLAAQGRGGDSMLVHMRPDEVAAMQNMAQQAGTSMTVNPYTGLPEAFQLKDVFNINTYTKPVKKVMDAVGLGGVDRAVSQAAKFAGQNAQYIVPFIPGAAFTSVGLGGLSSAAGRGLVGGVAGAMADGRPNLKRGLMAGLTSYGLSSAYQGLQDAGKVGEAAAVEPTAEAVQAPTEYESAKQGIKNLVMGDEATTKAASKAFGEQFGMGKAQGTIMGATGVMAIDEQEKLLEQAKAENRIAEAEYQQEKARIAAARKKAQEVVAANPYRFAIGGEVPLAMKAPPDTETNAYGMRGGGETGRYIDGPGDGMSDSVPATIGGSQPARLADGEFVIPADVVSHLGNGSTKAGAKQLYAMMDRIRQERTGTKKQGKEINPTKYMPA